jgi:ferritin-like metal-binding protein YciE
MSARDAKLAQYLSEAYGNEKRLETALQAHIGMATRPPYRKRLQQHLGETRRHANEVSRRMKQLGGSHDALPGVPSPLGDAAEVVVEGAQKATALAQGPLHALRGTGEAERELKNAKTEYAEEAQEIGMYSAIETLAGAVSDKQTQQLARGILRDERRMLAFLEKEIPRLTGAVVRAEIPSSQRNGAATRRRKGKTSRRSSTAKRTAGKGSSRRATASRASTRSSSTRRASSSSPRVAKRSASARSASARSGSARSSASTRTSKARNTRTRARG